MTPIKPREILPVKLLKDTRQSNKSLCPTVFLILFIIAVSAATFPAQTENQAIEADNFQTGASKEDGAIVSKNFVVEKDFRVEKVAVAGGAEIITIFANLKGLTDSPGESAEEVPLVSILRDTLGDARVENDRLRYVWMLNYTRPSFAQKFAAAIPFLYKRTKNKGKVGNGLPPAAIDIRSTQKEIWDKAFRLVFRNLILERFTVPARAAALQYQTNRRNYRKSSIARALALLSLYETIEGEKVLTDRELKDIQARMTLSDKFFGSTMRRENLERVYDANTEKINGFRGQNWELLRQYSEAQNLYFEPLRMPDGSQTHALVWLAESDLANNRNKNFNARFLNIKNPWNDARLENWRGYAETRWFDENNRQTAPNAPGAKPKRMIPLALYGLDYPKIPILLVDFRDRNNPKKREMSKRVLDDLTSNVLSVSRADNLPYFVGRYLYNFVTGRRGMDINQATRVGSYSQLKLLLSLNASLEPDFRDEIADRLESVSLNPLENDLKTEARLARRQYENLMAYAKRPDGLPARIEKERREEMTRLKHTGGQRLLYALGRALSLGIYRHREKYTPELRAEMDLRRRLDFHERFLLETARISVKPEIDSDLETVKDSLKFVAENGAAARKRTAGAIAKIFSITEDEQTRLLSLASLDRIDDRAAKKELLAIAENRTLDARWRDLSARYLKHRAQPKKQPVESTAANSIVEIDEQN